MSLPTRDITWPPAEHADRYRRMEVFDAWYSGDTTRLAKAYGGGVRQVTTGGPATTLNPTGNRVVRAIRAGASAFWGSAPADGEADTKRHLPTARDIAIISSELLFADPPRITVEGDRWDQDDPAPRQTADGPVYAYRKGDPTPDTIAAQERLDWLLDACGFEALCLAAAETQAALGAVALRIAWNKDRIKDRPVIDRVDADAMLPTHVWGDLEGVTFWRVVKNDDRSVLRHLELHEGGRIYHGLYEGDSTRLGNPVPLTDHPSTRDIQVDAEGALLGFDLNQTPIDGVTPRTAVSIPNMLPDPLDRRAAVGASDYSDAVLDLFEAGDILWTDMMNSAEDAKSRIIVSRQLLESKGAGQGMTFNMNQRVFQKVNLPAPEKEGGGLPIEKVQFEMRLAEYWAAIEAIYDRTIKAAGYNPQTMGTDDSVAQTATEYAGKNKRSLSTRDKKVRYWADHLESLLTGLLIVDAVEFASGITPYPVRVQFPEAVQPTMTELLAEAKLLKEVGAATLAQIVQHVHPDWDEGMVAETVADIQATSRVIDPITFGLGGQGLDGPRAGTGGRETGERGAAGTNPLADQPQTPSTPPVIP